MLQYKIKFFNVKTKQAKKEIKLFHRVSHGKNTGPESLGYHPLVSHIIAGCDTGVFPEIHRCVFIPETLPSLIRQYSKFPPLPSNPPHLPETDF